MGQIIVCWQAFIFGQFRCLPQTENHFTDNAFSARCGGAGEDNDNDDDDDDKMMIMIKMMMMIMSVFQQPVDRQDHQQARGLQLL